MEEAGARKLTIIPSHAHTALFWFHVILVEFSGYKILRDGIVKLE